MEHRRQGLCYNCDEPYVHGHVYQRLSYLELADYVVDDDATRDVATEDADQHVANPDATSTLTTTLTVSLHAITRVRTEDALLLPVHGFRVLGPPLRDLTRLGLHDELHQHGRTLRPAARHRPTAVATCVGGQRGPRSVPRYGPERGP